MTGGFVNIWVRYILLKKSPASDVRIHRSWQKISGIFFVNRHATNPEEPVAGVRFTLSSTIRWSLLLED